MIFIELCSRASFVKLGIPSEWLIFAGWDWLDRVNFSWFSYLVHDLWNRAIRSGYGVYEAPLTLKVHVAGVPVLTHESPATAELVLSFTCGFRGFTPKLGQMYHAESRTLRAILHARFPPGLELLLARDGFHEVRNRSIYEYLDAELVQSS